MSNSDSDDVLLPAGTCGGCLWDPFGEGSRENPDERVAAAPGGPLRLTLAARPWEEVGDDEEPGLPARPERSRCADAGVVRLALEFMLLVDDDSPPLPSAAVRSRWSAGATDILSAY